VTNLKKNITQLKKQARILHQQTTTPEQFDQCEQIEKLDVECQRLRNQVHSLTKELSIQNNNTEVEWRNSVIRLEAKVVELEDLLRSKTDEIFHLQEVITDHEKLRETEHNSNSETFRKQVNDSTEKIETLQQMICELTTELERKRKRHRTQLKAIQQENETKRNELSSAYDQSKQRFESMIATLQEKMETIRSSSQTLIQTLSESEGRNQQLRDENGQLRVSHRSLELKYAAIQETIQKEQLSFQNQLSASKLMMASQIQTMNQTMVSQINSQKEQLFEMLVKKLHGIYDIESRLIDDDGYDLLTTQIRVDLEKLQTFQSERVISTRR
jgi:chromosome segregation ATPase